MVRTNNCTSEINAWVKSFREFVEAAGVEMSTEALFTTLFNQALKGDPDCGGLLSYGYYSGENITKIAAGRPLFVRFPESRFTLANFMRLHLFSAFGAMKIGMDIPTKRTSQDRPNRGTRRDFQDSDCCAAGVGCCDGSTSDGDGNSRRRRCLGHRFTGGIYEKKIGRRNAYSLLSRVFQGKEGITLAPLPEDIVGFTEFVKRYQRSADRASSDRWIDLKQK